MCCFYASSFKASSVSFYPMEKNKNFLNSLCHVLIFVLSLSVFRGSCSCFDRCNLGFSQIIFSSCDSVHTESISAEAGSKIVSSKWHGGRSQSSFWLCMFFMDVSGNPNSERTH